MAYITSCAMCSLHETELPTARGYKKMWFKYLAAEGVEGVDCFVCASCACSEWREFKPELKDSDWDVFQYDMDTYCEMCVENVAKAIKARNRLPGVVESVQ